MPGDIEKLSQIFDCFQAMPSPGHMSDRLKEGFFLAIALTEAWLFVSTVLAIFERQDYLNQTIENQLETKQRRIVCVMINNWF